MQLSRRIRALERRRAAELDAAIERLLEPFTPEERPELQRISRAEWESETTRSGKVRLTPQEACAELAKLLGVSEEELASG